MRRTRGFTLIELTVVLALMTVFFALVVVRFDWNSPRQALNREARKLGNLLTTYREKALADETLWAVQMDLDTGKCRVVQPAEKSAQAVEQAVAVRTITLDPAVKLSRVLTPAGPLSSSFVMFFDAKGIAPDVTLEFEHAHSEAKVTLRVDPFATEIVYGQN